jgi:hypothetical protein
VSAGDVIEAIRHTNQGAAVVTELVIDDPDVTAAHAAYHAEMWPNYGRHQGKPPLTLAQWDTLFNEEPTQRRIDALMVKSGQRTAIEVKISRADYRRETPEKRRAWQAVTHRFVYAVPEGLITPDEVPDGCGLWYHAGDKVYVAKKARVNKTPAPLPDQITVALMYRAARLDRLAHAT